jgi:molybdopterin molybdotransferase
MTGAPIPDGADAVVPYEWTDRGVDHVRIDQAPEPSQHVRPAGDDVSVGDLLVTEGTVLGPRQVGLLANVGRATVLARPRPRVVVVSTGSELRDPGQELGHDSIYDGNSFMLAAAVLQTDEVPHRDGIVSTTRDASRRSRPPAGRPGRHQGGSRATTWSGVRRSGSRVLAGVAMQPGKPRGSARSAMTGCRSSPSRELVSAYISFDVRAACHQLMGLTPVSRPLLDARLTKGMTSPEDRRQFMRGQAGVDAEGRYVEPIGGPGSHLIGALSEANCLIVVPEQVTALNQGDRVQVLMLDTPF